MSASGGYGCNRGMSAKPARKSESDVSRLARRRPVIATGLLSLPRDLSQLREVHVEVSPDWVTTNTESEAASDVIAMTRPSR